MGKKNALNLIVDLLKEIRNKVQVIRASFPRAGDKGKRGFLCFIEVSTKSEVSIMKSIFSNFNKIHKDSQGKLPFRDITDAPNKTGQPRLPKRMSSKKSMQRKKSKSQQKRMFIFNKFVQYSCSKNIKPNY